MKCLPALSLAVVMFLGGQQAYAQSIEASPGCTTGIDCFSKSLTFSNGSRLDDTGSGVFRFRDSGSNSLTMTVAGGSLATFSGPITAGGDIQTTPGGAFYWPGRTLMRSGADGSITWLNNAASQSVTMTIGASNLASFNGPMTITGNLQVFSGSVSAGFAGIFPSGVLPGGSAKSVITSPADGQIANTNQAATDFSRLCIGPCTSSFPALSHSGDTLTVVLGNGSGGAGFQFGGLFIQSARVVTAAGAVVVGGTDTYVCINKTVGAPTTVSLPGAQSAGRTIIIKDCKGDAATNNITVSPASGLIDGAASKVMNTNYSSLTFISDGTNYGVN